MAAAVRAANGAALVSLTAAGTHWTSCESREANLRTRVSRKYNRAAGLAAFMIGHI